MADGAAAATITVTLKDGANLPLSGKVVALAQTSGQGSPIITTVSGTSDADGRATFTVASTTAGAAVFAATDLIDGNPVLAQTATATLELNSIRPGLSDTLNEAAEPPVLRRLFKRLTLHQQVMHKCLLLVGLLASAFALNNGTAADFFVSPAGADTNPGTQPQPFATLSRARDALRASGKLAVQPVTVHVLPGIYYLPETLIFTPADSGTATAPVVYQGDPGGEVVISGGLKLNLSWQPYQNGILQAKVPAGLAIDQLFLNGQRQHMARYPNYDPDQRLMHGYAADAFSPQRVARWSDPAGGFIHAMHPAEWGDVHFLITGKKPDGSLSYEGGWQNNRGGAMHKVQRFVENIFEELDAPGEWFYNPKTSTLYCYPPAGVDLRQAVVEVVRLRHLVELQGQPAKPVRFLTLRGLTFRHAARTFMQNREPLNRSDWTTYRGGAVFANGTEDCQLADCSFDQLGGNSIFVNAYNRRLAVRGCLIQAGGANGIAFVGDTNAVRSLLLNYNQPFDYARLDRTPGPQSDNYPADCLVEDCLITRTGQFERQTAGVQISMSTGITVRHCSIYDVPRAGINISEGCWGGHLIEFCDVFDTVKETGDHGSFNSWGRDRYWHSDRATINREVAADPALPRLDILKPNVLRNSRWRCDHGWDIDLDDGSSYYEIYNNLCLNGGIKNREGYHRLVTNNIIVNNSFHPHVWLANSGDVFKHNIVMGAYRPAIMPPGKWGQEVDYNFFTTSESDRARFAPNDCDAHSLVGDPLFVDPAAGNYQLREGSPALKLGFQNFPMDQFGVRKPALRAIAKTPQLPQLKPVAATTPVPERLDFFCQARVRDISGLGDRSAYGLPDESGVLLLDVPPASPLGRAGFLKDDVLLECNAQPVRNLAGLLQLQKLAHGTPLNLSALRKQQTVTAQVRDYAPDQQSQPLPAFTNPAPATLRLKADAPTYLYGAGASVREGNLRKQAGDCKTGNPNRIIALNSWIYPNVSEWQDYWAGEAYNLIGLPVNGANERGPGQGLRYQALVVMEPYWVQEKAAMTPPRFSAQTLGDFITGCIHNGGAVTINLGIYQDGSVDPAAVDVLKEVRKLVRQSPQ